MKKIALLLVVMFSCTNEEGAMHALKVSGYKNIELTGHEWTSCSKDDNTCTGFEATAPSGAVVTGAVGCGYSSGCGKGCTIRISE